ncbi:coenzyme F420-0:L-glutamate ligase [Natrialbaceae archaeon A-chndr2]
MELQAIPNLPEIRPGDDIAELILNKTTINSGDVLTIASTIISKAEGRAANFEDFPPSPRAKEIASQLEELSGGEKDARFVQAILEESSELIIDAPFLLTETHFGHVGVNAGIDRSNVPNHDLLLLPKRPGKSAKRIQSGLIERGIEDITVIVTDTCGRPFRHGQRGVAIGWAGISANRDWRGEQDRDGRELGVTVQSVVDELASASNLITGEGAAGTPAVVIREWDFGDHSSDNEIFRELENDYVRQALREWQYNID